MENPFATIAVQLQRVESMLIEIKRLQANTTKGNTEPEVMTIQQASELTNYAVQTLYCKVSKREIPFVKKGGKLWFNRQALLNWMNEGAQGTIEEQTNNLVLNCFKRKRRA
ncbi:helix-turn-helix domain-containing protein [Pontibacter harenae]|uniref:helix-turn-helix domain-containing protein n=1 Tax=Pontibacter harenae TaxID=2894083 RepID=UPI001E3AF4A2|nr:helix-turn-helix domain-containing protein [Pontibacter harenae]MCC9166875.1 helix-turn-helix domain-containing protein [Pontibacter harenae]